MSPDVLLELEDELLLVDELLLEELLLDELLLDELEDELLEEDVSSSPPPQAASIALNIPIISILRIIVVAPHMTPAIHITNMDSRKWKIPPLILWKSHRANRDRVRSYTTL